jgi:hypothetical protein
MGFPYKNLSHSTTLAVAGVRRAGCVGGPAILSVD